MLMGWAIWHGYEFKGLILPPTPAAAKRFMLEGRLATDRGMGWSARAVTVLGERLCGKKVGPSNLGPQNFQTGKMAQQVKVLAAKSNNLSSLPSHKKKALPRVVL